MRIAVVAAHPSPVRHHHTHRFALERLLPEVSQAEGKGAQERFSRILERWERVRYLKSKDLIEILTSNYSQLGEINHVTCSGEPVSRVNVAVSVIVHACPIIRRECLPLCVVV